MTTEKCNKITPLDADVYPTYENMAAIEFKMQMAIDNPVMYTLEELQAMQREYDEASAAADKLMRDDFQSMPPEMQKRMLQLLAGDEAHTPQFWLDILGL